MKSMFLFNLMSYKALHTIFLKKTYNIYILIIFSKLYSLGKRT